MRAYLKAIALVTLFSAALGSVNIPPLNFAAQHKKSSPKFNLLQSKPYTVKYFNQLVDHFNYSNVQTYKMRYLEDKSKWNGKGLPLKNNFFPLFYIDLSIFIKKKKKKKTV